MTDTPLNNRTHYLFLDGLRGIAALMVLGFHLFEAVAFAADEPEQKLFHGFLAVDFFLVLSGFVMGYAYDNEWDKMSVGKFFKKRLIRLHPMVVMGVAIGLIAFLFQGGLKWDGTANSWINIALSTLLALLLLPSPAKLDVRGNTEIFPLNGPHWSLFFEYIGNILYALAIRKFSTKTLKIWVAITGISFLCVGIFGPYGSLGYGWSSQPISLLGGFLRMSFDYGMGMLLIRIFREKEVNNEISLFVRNDTKRSSVISSGSCGARNDTDGTFVISSGACGARNLIKKYYFLIFAALLILLLCIPSLGKFNVYFEFLCIAICFPTIIWFAAKGVTHNNFERKSLKFIGDLSYPLYAVHYPFIYLYIGWINEGKYPFGPYEWCTPLAIALIVIAVATICMKFFDFPIRRWLTKKS